MKKALFIGRFQPFHLGHLSALTQIAEEHIIIGVGSSQYSDMEKNPFSFEERQSMINATLPKDKKTYDILAIPDIHDPDNWVAHVETLVGKVDVIYTGNDTTKALFEQADYDVKISKYDIDISGTRLRHFLKKNNSEYKKYIPAENIDFVTSYYGQ
jgi:nicotinamide-nucleotide adenylyltransferase